MPTTVVTAKMKYKVTHAGDLTVNQVIHWQGGEFLILRIELAEQFHVSVYVIDNYSGNKRVLWLPASEHIYVL